MRRTSQLALASCLLLALGGCASLSRNGTPQATRTPSELRTSALSSQSSTGVVIVSEGPPQSDPTRARFVARTAMCSSLVGQKSSAAVLAGEGPFRPELRCRTVRFGTPDNTTFLYFYCNIEAHNGPQVYVWDNNSALSVDRHEYVAREGGTVRLVTGSLKSYVSVDFTGLDRLAGCR